MKDKHEVQNNELLEKILQDEELHELLTSQVFSALSNAVEANDRYTNGHSQRVAKYSAMIAKRLGCTEKQQHDVYYAGMLHDVGKLRIPSNIINKTERLSEKEYDEMRLHTLAGYYILKEISSVSDFAVGARWHHERYDGKGYPNGLSGENIPLICRIIGVADAYDAMTSNRSYRSIMTQAEVREQFVKGRGTQFDPQLADIMIDIIDEDKAFVLHQPEPPLWRTVLAVDDDPMVLQLLQFLIGKDTSLKLITASSTDECIETLKKQKDVCLVLLDVEMPGKDGFCALEWIRKNNEHLPVIFMTGDKEMEIIQKAEAMGISDYLTKPLVPRMLMESINNVLSITKILNTIL